MSHFSVLVITAEEPTDVVLARVLQPFHEYECTGIDDEYVKDVDVTDKVIEDHKKYGSGDPLTRAWVEGWNGATERDGRYYCRTNPNRKWDWWVRGGRYLGKLKVAAGANAYKGRPGAGGNDARHEGGVDSCQIRHLNLKGMQDDLVRAAEAEYDVIHRVIAGRPIRSFDEVRGSRSRDELDAVREEFWSQPALADLKERNLLRPFDNVEDYLVPRDKFVERARNAALGTFAVLKDGVWYERGEMGWWGCVFDEKDHDRWDEEFRKLVEGLAPETWITIVDCHI